MFRGLVKEGGLDPVIAPRDEPEFSRFIEIAGLGETEEVVTIEANAAERAKLAQRFSLLALDGLSAELTLRPLEGGAVRVSGRLEADVTQACVISLEPVPARIVETFSAVFGAPEASLREVTLEMAEDDPPEPIEGGRIDLGELVAQHLALAIDPYPRAFGASLDEGPAREGEETLANRAEEAANRPFAALAKLTGREKDRR